MATKFFNLILIIVCFSSTVLSQYQNVQNSYANNPLYSTQIGQPLKNLESYYCISTQYLKLEKPEPFDTYDLGIFAAPLFVAKEPVLSNYYLGKEMLRLVLYQTFHLPIIITLTKENNNVTMRYVELDKIPTYEMAFYDKAQYPYPFSKKGFTINDSEVILGEPDIVNRNDSLHRLETLNRYQPTQIKNETTINLSLTVWDTCFTLLKQADYWNMRQNHYDECIDGSTIYLETHLREQYWIVKRRCDLGTLESVIKYILVLKEKKY